MSLPEEVILAAVLVFGVEDIDSRADDTILRWYRRLIAQKYDGSARRRRGRPMTPRAVTETRRTDGG